MTALTRKGGRPIATAPAETDLCLCIEDAFGVYRLPFHIEEKGNAKPYLTGDKFTIADAYAYAILNWTKPVR